MLSDPVVFTAVSGSAATAAIVDLRTRRVPNWLTLGVAATGLALAAAHVDGVRMTAALEGLAIGLLLMLPGHVIGRSGAGDVKLLAAVGTLLGPRLTVLAFMYAAIAGGVLAVLVAVSRRRLQHSIAQLTRLMTTGGANVSEIERPSADNRFAYAPAIAVGAILAAFRL